MTDASTSPGNADARTSVAILGGGCGGLAAAWELTRPEMGDRFDVTVYELGWRLGGKGAAGRASHAGGQRIEEHGVHVWFGFYDHAFRLVEEAYAEARAAHPELDLDLARAFVSMDAAALYGSDGTIHKNRKITDEVISPNGGRRLIDGLATVVRVVLVGLKELAQLAGSAPAEAIVERLQCTAMQLAASDLLGDDDPLCDHCVPLSDHSQPLIVYPRQQTLAGAHESRARTHELLGEISAGFQQLAAELGPPPQVSLPAADAADAAELARLLAAVHAAQVVAALVRGCHDDEVVIKGLGSIDVWDAREWLCRHGAPRDAVDRSILLKAIYNLSFAYLEGNEETPSLAAGKALQMVLMMAAHDPSRGVMSLMCHGMGDTVFAPLYLALRRRGVRFNFFTRVDELQLGGEGTGDALTVEGIAVTRQAQLRGGPDSYQPLIAVGDRRGWPAQPLWSQVKDAAGRRGADFEHDVVGGERVKLRRGVDFDQVVLAIPVGALAPICRQLVARSRRFGEMLGGACVVATQALQVWLKQTVAELLPPGTVTGLVPPSTGFWSPFETYCDMSHVVADELHGANPPAGAAYFCSVLPDQDASDRVRAARLVRDHARTLLDVTLRPIWPRAYEQGSFRWDEVLYDPREGSGAERLDAQYWRANISPSERYVLTPAGSVCSRLWPHESGFDNLVLAGDWTHNVIDGGCIEAAVISGVCAARTLGQRAAR